MLEELEAKTIAGDKIKKLLASGCTIPNVSEIEFIQVSRIKNLIDREPIEIDVPKR
jgi:hypothetical protein